MADVVVKLGPVALERIRAIQRQVSALETQRADLLSVAVESHGHDLAVLQVRRLDLDAGEVTLAVIDEGVAEEPT